MTTHEYQVISEALEKAKEEITRTMDSYNERLKELLETLKESNEI